MNYFEYTGADLYQLTEAFSDYLDCPEDCTPHFYLTSQGILTHLENELYSYMNEHSNETGEFAFLELDEDLHSYILYFLSELREDVRKRMNRRTEETSWREKFEYLTKLYKELDARKPRQLRGFSFGDKDVENKRPGIKSEVESILHG